jgi:hypothetical protein
LSRVILRVGESPELDAGVPPAEELVTSPFGRTLLALVSMQATVGRPTAVPPGVPADRLEALRQAYAATLRDPELLAEAARMQFPIDPLDGADVDRRIRQALDQSPEVIYWLRKIVERGVSD